MNIKKKKYKGKILLIIIFIIIIFSLFYFFINDKNKNNHITNGLKDITSFISKITTFSFLKDNNYNKDLINEINNDYKNEIKNLKDVLELNKLNSDKKLINSIVIKRSLNDYYNIITIDKGSKDGIKEGQAVINKNGLIGTVLNVNKSSSDVKLITALNNNYISAKFNYDGKDYYGIINKYDNKTNKLTLINIIGDINKEKIINTNVVTSGLTDNIQSGLLIGKINNIKKDTLGISYIIEIELSININNINIVSVVGDNND